MNLYELNQAGYAALPTMTKEEIISKKDAIFNFMSGDNLGSYYMLLCNELRYYTLFDVYRPFGKIITGSMVDEILEIIISLGELKAIEVNSSMIEFWVLKDNECHMYAFFNYDNGVIQL